MGIADCRRQQHRQPPDDDSIERVLFAHPDRAAFLTCKAAGSDKAVSKRRVRREARQRRSATRFNAWQRRNDGPNEGAPAGAERGGRDSHLSIESEHVESELDLC
jgi:hypothetical protein